MAAVAGAPDDRAPSIDVKTGADGVFSILGVPDADVYLSAGPSAPSTGMPYRRIYYPDGLFSDSAPRLRLKPGEIRTGITLTLEPPLHARRVKVHVASSDGLPADGILVRALVNGTVQESARTSADGNAKLPCLDGISYEVDALFFPPARTNLRFRLGAVETPAVRVECGPNTQLFT